MDEELFVVDCGDGVKATAKVIRGGNQVVRVAVAFVAEDDRGTPLWQGEAVAHVALPYGSPIPTIRAVGVEAEVVGSGPIHDPLQEKE